MCTMSLHVLREQERIAWSAGPAAPPPVRSHPPRSSSHQMPQSFGATRPYSSHMTPTMPAYTNHSESRNVPSSSRATSCEIKLRRIAPSHISSPVMYNQGSGYLALGDDEDFNAYVYPLLTLGQRMEMPFIHTEGCVSPVMSFQSTPPYLPSYLKGPSHIT